MDLIKRQADEMADEESLEEDDKTEPMDVNESDNLNSHNLDDQRQALLADAKKAYWNAC